MDEQIEFRVLCIGGYFCARSPVQFIVIDGIGRESASPASDIPIAAPFENTILFQFLEALVGGALFCLLRDKCLITSEGFPGVDLLHRSGTTKQIRTYSL